MIPQLNANNNINDINSQNDIKNHNQEQRQPKILWSAITRNETILVETGGDPYDGAVAKAARAILAKKYTPGWEFLTLHQKPKRNRLFRSQRQKRQQELQESFQSSSSISIQSSTRRLRKASSLRTTVADERRAQHTTLSPVPRLKAIKFHVYDDRQQRDDDFGRDDGWEFEEEVFIRPPPIVWVFAAVYNAEADATATTNSTIQGEIQAFLQHLIAQTTESRRTNPVWRTGPTLACQNSFGPTLWQHMEGVNCTITTSDHMNGPTTASDRLRGLQEQQQQALAWIHSNISQILRGINPVTQSSFLRDHRDYDDDDNLYCEMHEAINATTTPTPQHSYYSYFYLLEFMTESFQRTVRSIRRRILMQQARHGMVVGSLISVVVGVCIVPPIVLVVLL